MAGSTYKIVELVGTSDKSWEEATAIAIETAGESLRISGSLKLPSWMSLLKTGR